MYSLPKRFTSFSVQIVMTHVVMTQLVMIIPGCFYDWEVGPPASAGGSTSSSGGGGSGGSGGSDCVALTQALEAARADAKACTFGVMGQCNASIKDERGCTSWVNDGASPQAGAFLKAVADFQAAGCTPSTDICGTTMPACLYQAGKPVCVP